MRTWLLALTLLLTPLLPACGGADAHDQLLGTWTLDLEAMKEHEDFKSAPEADKKMMEGMLAAMKLDITFTEDKIKTDMSMMGMSEQQEHEYSVTSAEGDKLVLSSKDEDGKVETLTVTVSADTLEFDDGDDSFSLKRK